MKNRLKGFLKGAAGLLAVVLIVSSFSSCQKEITNAFIDSIVLPVDTIPNSVSTKVKTYTEDVTTTSGDHQSETFTLTYDNKDRLLTMIAASDPGNKFVYQYNTNNTYSFDIYNQNVINIHVDLFLNSLLLVDSTIQTNDTNDTSTEKYVYNAAKQLITKRDYDYTSSLGYTLTNTYNYEYDSNGNATKEASNNQTFTYDYYSTLENSLNIGFIYFYRNPNLTKTTTLTESGTTTTSIRTYTFDNSNRLITEKTTTSTGDVAIKSYTYY